MVKDPSANTGDIRDMGLIPGSGRPSGGGYGSSLQFSCLENPMDCIFHGVAKESDTTEQLSMAWSGGNHPSEVLQDGK